jgi:hypothetical protein
MANASPLSADGRKQLTELLRRTYFANTPKDILDSDDGRFLIEQHVEQRHSQALHSIAPWVERTVGLRGRRVVEIGSGTSQYFAVTTFSIER